MRVVFLHPDLGIGGAERLVVDAATALQSHGHTVTVVTAHHDRTHCFDETKDGTLDVRTYGDWLPRSVLGRCCALFAYIRMCYAALAACLTPAGRGADVLFVDQVAACLPIVRLLLPRARVVFYCHFPDQLLTNRESMVKRVYRLPIDCLEEWSTGLAHCILVNSAFTESIFRRTFRTLSARSVTILYPTFAVPPAAVDNLALADLPASAQLLFLSINRYERKKNIDLALTAFAMLLERVDGTVADRCHLAIAGGYDSRVTENVQHYAELRRLAKEYGLYDRRGHADRVTFFRSPSDGEKRALFDRCACVLYTPRGEHFGIVPVEAMAAGRPVIAVNDAGPKETVEHDVTGILCEPSSLSFALAMQRVALNADRLVPQFGAAGALRANRLFGKQAFANQLHNVCTALVAEPL